MQQTQKLGPLFGELPVRVAVNRHGFPVYQPTTRRQSRRARQVAQCAPSRLPWHPAEYSIGGPPEAGATGC